MSSNLPNENGGARDDVSIHECTLPKLWELTQNTTRPPEPFAPPSKYICDPLPSERSFINAKIWSLACDNIEIQIHSPRTRELTQNIPDTESLNSQNQAVGLQPPRLEELIEIRRERGEVVRPCSGGCLFEYPPQLRLDNRVVAIFRAAYNLHPSVDHRGWAFLIVRNGMAARRERGVQWGTRKSLLNYVRCRDVCDYFSGHEVHQFRIRKLL